MSNLFQVNYLIQIWQLNFVQTFNCKQEIWIEASWCFGNEKTLSMLMVPMVPDFFFVAKKNG